MDYYHKNKTKSCINFLQFFFLTKSPQKALKQQFHDKNIYQTIQVLVKLKKD